MTVPNCTHRALSHQTGHLVPARRISSQIEIESPDHPFFKDGWFGNAHPNTATPGRSTPEIRKENGGFVQKQI
jgi:hypothetical protein